MRIAAKYDFPFRPLLGHGLSYLAQELQGTCARRISLALFVRSVFRGFDDNASGNRDCPITAYVIGVRYCHGNLYKSQCVNQIYVEGRAEWISVIAGLLYVMSGLFHQRVVDAQDNRLVRRCHPGSAIDDRLEQS